MRSFPLFLLTLAAVLPAQDKPAAAPAPAAAADKKPETPTVKIIEEQGRRFVLIKSIESAPEVTKFQQDLQALASENQDVQQTKQLAELALTSPEKEARQRQLESKLQKLNATNQEMFKAYGFSLLRQYVILPTKLEVFKVLTDDEFIKLAASPTFDKASVIDASGKKLQRRTMVTGAVEVRSFQASLRIIGERRQQLRQLLELQPTLTKEEEKKKVATAIARVQQDVNEAEVEFAKEHGIPFSEALATQIAAAELYTLLSDEENKQFDKSAADAKAPAAAPADKK